MIVFHWLRNRYLYFRHRRMFNVSKTDRVRRLLHLTWSAFVIVALAVIVLMVRMT